MKKLYLLSAVLLTGVMACNKDNISGKKPQITFLSYSATEIPANSPGGLVVTFNVKDGDGDIENYLHVQTNWTSPHTELPYDEFKMPEIGPHSGKSVNAEVILNLDATYVIPNPNGTDNPDTLFYRVYVEDNAGNVSDTITTPKIAIFR